MQGIKPTKKRSIPNQLEIFQFIKTNVLKKIAVPTPKVIKVGITTVNHPLL